MEYRVQRPSTVWVETIVEAESFDEALELANDDFYSGDFRELDDTFDMDYDRFWIEDENGDTKENE